MLKISFHGAAGTVTGSRHLLKSSGARFLVDAGLFQGLKELRLLNWEKPPFDPASLDSLLLTHAHIDHLGYLPRLVREGFAGPVHATPATVELAEIVLKDSAHLQEEEAAYANKKGFSKHTPALPLYDLPEAEAALRLLRPVAYEEWLDLGDGWRARFLNAGHILGSAHVEIRHDGPGREIGLLLSGDVGRYGILLHTDPTPPPACDLLVMEATYGDRRHDDTPIARQIAEPLRQAFARRGIVLIPAFAVGRAQQVIMLLGELMASGEIPEVPIHINSPLALEATRIYQRHLRDHNLDEELAEEGANPFFPPNVHFHRTLEESKALNERPGPHIIISASGMLSGGRILHHLARCLPDRRNMVLLVGYQAPGTRGRALLDGARSVRIHGADVDARAEIHLLHGLSGHADAEELLRWVRSGSAQPKAAFLVHGDPDALAAMARRLESETQVPAIIPRLHGTFSLDKYARA